MSLQKLRIDVDQIKARNKKVEADKAWETSWTRKIVLFVLTYFVIVIFLFVADLPKPWINAIVPALAFVLSTLSLPIIKQVWMKSKQ